MRGIKARLHEARVRKESGTRRKNKKTGVRVGEMTLKIPRICHAGLRAGLAGV